MYEAYDPRNVPLFLRYPYDENLLKLMRERLKKIDPGPQRMAFLILMQTVQMDLHSGGVLRQFVLEPILTEMSDLAVSEEELKREHEAFEAARKEARESVSALMLVWKKIDYRHAMIDKIDSVMHKIAEMERLNEELKLMSIKGLLKAVTARLDEITDLVLKDIDALNDELQELIDIEERRIHPSLT